jgi:hypothetical protein
MMALSIFQGRGKREGRFFFVLCIVKEREECCQKE